MMSGRWFLPADLESAAKDCSGLKLLQDANFETVAAQLNTQAVVAASFVAAPRPPREDRKRKLGAIARAARDLLKILDLPGDISPSVAHSTSLPLAIAEILRPGLSDVRVPYLKQLISLAGGSGLAERVKEIEKAYGDDGKQAASLAIDRAMTEATLRLVPLILATLREVAERGLAIVEAEPKPHSRGNTLGVRVLLRALAAAHEALFGNPPQLRNKISRRDTPSLWWIKAVIERAARRLAADLNTDPSASALFEAAAGISTARLSDTLRASLRA
jgi:hypothetical protein